MNFFRINPRRGYASYVGPDDGQEINEPRITPPYRKVEPVLTEYLGDPPRKPGKHGDIHKSANAFFVGARAREIFHAAAREHVRTASTRLVGRENEDFHQVWVLNFVDCLDLGRTIASPSSGFYKDKIGVITRPVFDETRWDGSDLFVVPQDPSYCFFCTERFIERWREAKFKGAMFSRFLMDPNAISC